MRISSNLTLFYKVFIPIFWIVLFGAILASIWTLPVRVSGLSTMSFRIVATLFYFGMLLFLYWACMRLKRIEIDENYIYVSNYFKNYRYPHHDIEKIVRPKRPIFSIAYIYLKGKGSLGSRISFVPASSLYDDFFRIHKNLEFPVEG